MSRLRPAGARYLLPKSADGLWGPPSIVVNGYRGSCSGFKRPECDSDRTPPSRAKVKNTCSYTSSHPLLSRTIYMQLEVERSFSLSWSRHSQLCVTSKFSAISTTARHRSPARTISHHSTPAHTSLPCCLLCKLQLDCQDERNAPFRNVGHQSPSETTPHPTPKTTSCHSFYVCVYRVGGFCLQVSHLNVFVHFLISTARAACSTQLLFLPWFILVIFRGEYSS